MNSAPCTCQADLMPHIPSPIWYVLVHLYFDCNSLHEIKCGILYSDVMLVFKKLQFILDILKQGSFNLHMHIESTYIAEFQTKALYSSIVTNNFQGFQKWLTLSTYATEICCLDIIWICAIWGHCSIEARRSYAPRSNSTSWAWHRQISLSLVLKLCFMSPGKLLQFHCPGYLVHNLDHNTWEARHWRCQGVPICRRN